MTETTAIQTAFAKAGGDLYRLRLETAKLCENFMNSGGTLDLWNEIGAAVANEMAGRGHLQRADNGHGSVADPRQPNPEPGGQDIAVAHCGIAPSARDPIAGSGGHEAFDAQPCTAPAVQQPPPGEASHRACDAQIDHARPVREPIPGEGQVHTADEAMNAVPSAGNPIGGDDHPMCVRQDQTRAVVSTGLIASGEARTRLPEKASTGAPPAREPSAADLASMNEAADRTYFQMITLRARAWTTYRFKDLRNVRALNMRENMIINDVIDWGRKNRVADDKFVHLHMPVKEMRGIVDRAKGAILAHAKLSAGKQSSQRRA